MNLKGLQARIKNMFLIHTYIGSTLTLFRLGFLRVAQLGEGWGGGGRKVPAAYNSKTINDNEMKLVGVVKDH